MYIVNGAAIDKTEVVIRIYWLCACNERIGKWICSMQVLACTQLDSYSNTDWSYENTPARD